MSAIAKTASITLITAVPGSGKSLRAVWYAKQAVDAGEQVYTCNITGLSLPGVVDFPDPTQWEDLPPGSVLIVDEAQRFFRAGRGVPDCIAAMETIRHVGIRLLLITQHPTLIHGNIRALVGYHEHLVRKNGSTTVTVYTRSRVIDNVRSDKGLAAEDHHTWSFPTECYSLYRSAEVHTVKRTIPKKYIRAAMLFGLAALLVGFVAWRMKSNVAREPAAAQSAPATARWAAAGEARPKIVTAEEYARQVTPLVHGVPWTAPAWVGRPIVSDPRVLCIAVGQDGQDGCHCYTEQATRFEMDLDRCLVMAREGEPYNPYKAPQAPRELPAPDRGDQAAGQAQGAPGEAVAALAIGQAGMDPVPNGTFRP